MVELSEAYHATEVQRRAEATHRGPDAWDTLVAIRSLVDRSGISSPRRFMSDLMEILDATDDGCIGARRRERATNQRLCPNCGCNAFKSNERLATREKYWTCYRCEQEVPS